MQASCILRADDNCYYDAFARIKDHINSLRFLFGTFFDDRETREAKWNHRRINWEAHVLQLQHENLFKRTYRMSLQAFEKLTHVLGKDIVIDEVHCPVLEHIPPEIVVAVGIRYLSGGKCLDLKTAYGLSLSSVYRCRDLFILAVNRCPELDIRMPATRADMEKVAKDFAAVSTGNLVRGCVGCIDGFLAITKRPTMKESMGKPGAFFSGHYGVFGLNVQAVCDIKCRFQFFGVVAPGKCGDQVAFERTPLFQYVKHLPDGYYIIGDAAYSVGEKMLTPFTGGHRNDPTKDAYNFFLSQMRIRIEMSFGLLTNKWRILQTPMQTSLQFSSEIVMACGRLHNYCIDEDGEHKGNTETILAGIEPNRRAPFGWGYTPTIRKYRSIPGTSIMRDMLLRKVTQQGMRRPPGNLVRRRYELHEVGLM
ncbi:nuclease [Fragilaria crotonensis]|nr:nuclease [Fragilaria crotonensis]